MIRDRIVVGVLNQQLSEKMQLDPELTLEKATNLARQSEAVKKQQVALHKSPEENVDRIFRKDASQQGGKERNGEKKNFSIEFTNIRKSLFKMWQ